MKEQLQELQGNEQASGDRSRLWRVIASTALVLALASLVVNLPDIKRYIKISTM